MTEPTNEVTPLAEIDRMIDRVTDDDCGFEKAADSLAAAWEALDGHIPEDGETPEGVKALIFQWRIARGILISDLSDRCLGE